MLEMSLKSKFIQHLENQYEGLKSKPLADLVSENLLCPFDIQLPPSVLKQGQDFISACFQLRQRKEYAEFLAPKAQALGLKDPGNYGIMMSYDFHLDETGTLKLIEINTNAAFLGLGYHMYLMRQKILPVANFKIENIRDCILQELHLFGSSLTLPSVVITDEKPDEQRLFVEFLVYQELFKSWGWPTEIRDCRMALSDPKPDFIYNRYTDFYFENPLSADLKKSFLAKSVCFSPHPYEYFLLADKERLTDWSSGFLETLNDFASQASVIKKHLLISRPVTPENKDLIWSERKKLFFKPMQEHGSKGSFKGGNISKTAFENLIQKRTLAQEYVVAPEVECPMPDGTQKFKYDLRFYAYQGQLQLVLARLYQGQTTNLRTPGGGFACVLFE